MKKITSFWNKPRIGAALLVLSFAIGCTQLFLNSFVDEGENFASGALALRGHLLYGDIFSHHFPFAHYWIEFVFRLFGLSVLAARLSLLLFQITAFGLAMKFSRYYLSVGIAALAWSLIRHVYFGNMVLYQNFSGASLFVVFAITFALLNQFISYGWKEILIIGIFSTIAILSNPLNIYSFLVVIIFLAASKVGLKRTTAIIFIVGVGLALYLGYLLITETLMDFYRNAIVFNSQILSKYAYTNPVRLSNIVEIALRAFNIQDPRWMNLNLLGALPDFPYTKVDYQLSTGFLYRLSIILTSLILLIHRQFLPAGFVYLFAATLLVRSDQDFHVSPFVIVSLLTAGWLITSEWRQNKNNFANQALAFKSHSSRKSLRFLVRKFQQFARATVFVLLIVLMVHGVESIAKNWQNLSYKANFAGYEQTAEKVHKLACGSTDVALGFYPSMPMIYFFTKMPTVSKYFYMYPWIAEIGLSDVISSLKSNTAVVYLDETGHVFHYQNKVYLSRLKNYLDTNYKQLDGFYLSPSLIQECHSN